jgi:hypothetical protein
VRAAQDAHLQQAHASSTGSIQHLR